MKRQEIINKWNSEADEYNQWHELGGYEKFDLLKKADDIDIEKLKIEFEII